MTSAYSLPATTMYPSASGLNVRRTIPRLASVATTPKAKTGETNRELAGPTCAVQDAGVGSSRSIRRRRISSAQSRPRLFQSPTLGAPHADRQNGCPAGSAYTKQWSALG